ncbi:multidrug effflux MFS transporter [Caenispirillum bisanense]|uniref:multidrug effflux MFS transporter n=1 Tax=Caenispirillum bisanense TaxID=414052 RepID=UPI0031DC8A19
MTPETRMALMAAVLAAVGPLSLSVYGPAMPAIAAAFQVPEAVIAPTMALYLAGFSAGQLVCGPLSDRYGRRPAMVGFLLLYLAGTLAAFLAPSVAVLAAGRLVQGLGASVGIAIARAMVRDRFSGQAAARILSVVGMVVSVAPALGPLAGGVVLELAPWRWVFVLMAVYAVALLAFSVLRLRETNSHAGGGALPLRHVVGTYGMLLTDLRFLSPALGGALSIGGIYTFVTVAPFVLDHDLGLTPGLIGPAMAAPAASYFVGAALAGRLLRRLPAARLMLWGGGLNLLAGLLGAALLLTLGPTLAGLVATMALWSFGVSLLMPGCSAGAMEHFPRTAGAAAALMGCLQMGTGMVGGLAAHWVGGTHTGLAVVPVVMACGAIAMVLAGRRRLSRPAGSD